MRLNQKIATNNNCQSNKSNEKTTGDAVLLLPDELYERYRKHPARQRFANNIRKAHEKAGIPYLGD